MTRSPTEIAISLAKELAPDLAPKPSEALEGFEWRQIPTLTPGMDYRDGVVYMTFPGQRTKEKQVGKGKAARTVISTDPATICITSERESFYFEPEVLHQRGWTWPRTFMQNPNDTAWDLHDIRTFLDEETKPPDPFEIWQEIRQIYLEYIEFSEDIHYDLMSVYVMLTYVFRLFQAIGYIHFHGTRDAGKSQNMAILNALAFNPLWQSSITPASLFRTLGGSVGTIMIDEAENWESENDKELLRILKAGYYEGAGVTRTEKDSNDRFTPINYPAYSPKIIASINPQDAVLTSRCIVINMRPALRTLPNFDSRNAVYQPLRNKLYLFAMHHTKRIEQTLDEWSENKRQQWVPELRNRQWQLAKPILVLADYIAGDMLVKPLAAYLTTYWESAVRNQNVVDRQALLLRALPRVMRDHTFSHEYYYYAKDIHKIVVQYLDEEEAKTYKTRSIIRNLTPLGFNEKRNSMEGIQVQLLEEQVRKAFIQRRLEPFEDDVDWLNGNVSYQTTPPTTQTTLLDLSDTGVENEKQRLVF